MEQLYENVSWCRLVDCRCGRDNETLSTLEERGISLPSFSVSKTGRCSTPHRLCSGNISNTFIRIWRHVSLWCHADCDVVQRTLIFCVTPVRNSNFASKLKPQNSSIN